MTNREFYGDFLLDCYIHHTGAGCIKGVPKPCDDVNCMECDWQDKMGYCNEEAIDEWLAKEYIEPENKVFEPQLNDIYFWIDGLHEVKCALWTNDNFDNIHKENGNACTDKEFVQEKAKQIQLYNLLLNFAYKVNEGWTPDWENTCQNKWCIYRSYSFHRWKVYYCNRTQSANEVLFKTKELAQRAIDEIIIPFEKEFNND